MRPLDSRYAVPVFVGATFLVSWTAWIAAFLLTNTQTGQTIGVMIGGFGPLVGAVITLWLRDVSLRDWLRELLTFRVGARWYLLALTLPFVFPVAHTLIMVAQGQSLTPALIIERLPMFAGAVLVTVVLGGGQEEFGWRGFLLPRLQHQYSALTSSVLLGVIWAVWHLPLYVIPSALYADRPFLPYIFVVIGLAGVLTWVYNSTGGALPVVMLLHASINNSNLFVPVPRELLTDSQTVTLYMIVQAVVALGVLGVLVAAYGSETLTRSSFTDRYHRVTAQVSGPTDD